MPLMPGTHGFTSKSVCASLSALIQVAAALTWEWGEVQYTPAKGLEVSDEARRCDWAEHANPYPLRRSKAAARPKGRTSLRQVTERYGSRKGKKQPGKKVTFVEKRYPWAGL